MDFNYKNFKYTIARCTGMVAVIMSAFLFSCGETNHQGGGVDANEGTNMGAGNQNNPADTLTVGGASDGTPPGYGAMKDTVKTPGLNLDSIRENQTGSNAVNSGTNSGEVNSSVNNNGGNSSLSDSVNKNTNSNTGDRLDKGTQINKNVNPTNKTTKENSGGNIK